MASSSPSSLPARSTSRTPEWNELVDQLMQASRQGDSTRICQLLEYPQRQKSHQSSNSLHAKLYVLPDHSAANKLRNALFRHHDHHLGTLPETVRPEEVFRCLLSTPNAFETPWLAIVDFVQDNCQAKSNMDSSWTDLRSSVAEIQSFLQQTAATWWEKERRYNYCHLDSNSLLQNLQEGDSAAIIIHSSNMTPRDYILQITRQAVEPLLLLHSTTSNAPENLSETTTTSQSHATITSNNNHNLQQQQQQQQQQNWMVLLELLETVISLSRDLEPSLSDQVLDLFFCHSQRTIRSDRLLPWLNVAMEINPYLRQKDWQSILRTLFHALVVANEGSDWWTQNNNRTQQDLPGLAQTILSLFQAHLQSEQISISSFGKVNSSKNGSVICYFLLWKRLVLKILYISGTNHNTFSTVSTFLQSSFASLSTGTIQIWNAMDDHDKDNKNVGLLENMTFLNTTTEQNIGVPNWLRANMILIVQHAVRRSGSELVTKLMSKALLPVGASGNPTASAGVKNTDMAFQSWTRLLALAGLLTQELDSSPKQYKRKRERRDQQSSLSWFQQLEPTTLFRTLQYTGSGRFLHVTTDNESIVTRRRTIIMDALKNAGALVYQSLFLGLQEATAAETTTTTTAAARPNHETQTDTARGRNPLYVVERAQVWVHIVKNRFTSTPLSLQDILFGAATLITIYCEVPMSRSSLVRDMIQSIVSQPLDPIVSLTSSSLMSSSLASSFHDETDDLALFHCWIIAVLLRSTTASRRGTKNAHELNAISDLFAKQNLPKRIFIQLANALSCLPSARTALLAASRKSLESPLSQVWWWHLDATASSSDNVSDRQTDRIYCGLYGLLVVVTFLPVCDDEDDDTVPLEAWSLLSELLVWNQPSLPITARSWLFQQIGDMMISLHNFPLPLARHFLRVCLIRLLQFCGQSHHHQYSPMDTASFVPEKSYTVWSDPSTPTAKFTAPTEDIYGLCRLVLRLFFFMVEKSSNVSFQDLSLQEWRQSFVNYCLEASSEPPQVTRLPDPGDEHDDVLLCRATMAIMGYILNCVVLRSNNDATQDAMTFLPSVASLGMELERNEVKNLEQECNSNIGSLMPKWLMPSSTNPHLSVVTGTVDREASDKVIVSLCLVIANFLKDYRLYSMKSVENDGITNHRKNLIALMKISNIKWQATRNKPNNEVISETAFSTSGLENYERFFLAFARVIEDILSRKRSLIEADHIIAILLEQLDDLQSFLKLKDFPDDDRDKLVMLGNRLWELYRVIAGEASAVRFILYIEDQHQQEDFSSLATKQSRNGVSLLLADSPEKIDDTIRLVRLSFAQTIHFLLTVIQDHRASMNARNAEEITLAMNCLRGMAVDLRQGLEGRSGGFSVELFVSYVDAIQASTDVLIHHVGNHHELGVLREASIACDEALSSLAELLTKYPVRLKGAFTKIVTLVIHSIPQTRRILSRELSFGHVGTDIVSQGCGRVSEELGLIIFSQFVNFIKDLLGKKSTSNLLWKQIVTKHPRSDRVTKDGETETEDTGEVMSTRRDTDIPAEIQVTTGVASSDSALASPNVSVRGWMIVTPEMHVWACLCSIHSIEQNWKASAEVMAAMEPDGDCIDQPLLSAGETTFFKQRTLVLRETVDAFGAVLMPWQHKHQEALESKSVEAGEIEILATTFPDSVKMRICGLIDRMFRVLHRAVSILDSYLRQAISLEEKSRDAIIEALLCLLAWFYSENDVVTGVRLWHMCERRQYRQMQSRRAVHVAEGIILKRLPILVSKSEQLTSALRRLYSSLEKSRAKGTGYTKAVEMVETAVESVDILGCVASDLPSLSHLLEQKLACLISKSVELEKLEREWFGDKIRNSKVRGKKRKGSHTKSDRLRGVLRSRNQTVDTWLQSDQNIGGEEGYDSDAYVDLEDFIVDG